MANYDFLTTWYVDAPVERVFEVLRDSTGFPRWWPDVRSVEVLEPGDGNGVGELARFSWRGALPYTLRFDSRITRVEPPYLIEGHARGDLEGVGTWRLFAGADGTAILYRWKVRTTKPWMNMWGPLLRPGFNWNHARVMQRGGAGLAEQLQAKLLLHD